MPKTAVITARIEPELKEEAEDILNELGLSISQAIAIYFKQITIQRGIPFALKLPRQEPTRLLLEEATAEADSIS